MGDYYPPQVMITNPYTKMSALKSGLMYGTILGLFVVAVWWVWATTVYKWSISRIGGLMAAKYSALNQKLLTDNEDSYLSQENIVVAVDRTHATGTMVLTNNKTDQVLNREDVRYTLTTDPTECGQFSITKCILV